MMSNWIKYTFCYELFWGSYGQHTPGEAEGKEKQKACSLLLRNVFEEHRKQQAWGKEDG